MSGIFIKYIDSYSGINIGIISFSIYEHSNINKFILTQKYYFPFYTPFLQQVYCPVFIKRKYYIFSIIGTYHRKNN